MSDCEHEHFFIGYGKPSGADGYGSYKICLTCGEKFEFVADDDRETEEEM